MSVLSLGNAQMAIQKCLSHNETERKQAYDYLSECESNNDFLPIMFECFVTLQNTDAGLSALIYIKNTIKRMMAIKHNRKVPKSNTALNKAEMEETMTKVRDMVLELVQNNYNEKVEKQVIEIIGVIAYNDFPAKWEKLAKYLLCGLESAKTQIINENKGKQTIETLSPTLITQFCKFISIYRTVIKEQMRKKLEPTKAHFYKLAKAFLEATYSLVLLFDSAFQRIFSNGVSITLIDLDTTILKIGYSLDKLMLSVVFCGFNQSELGTQTDLIEIKLIHKYLEKLKCYIDLIQAACKCSAEQPFTLLCKFSKGILDKLSDMQHKEAIIMFTSLEQYLNGVLAFLLMGSESYFPEELQRACLLCLNRVLDTTIYKEKDSKMFISGKYSGVVISSTKFRNLGEYIAKVRLGFNSFFNAKTVINLFDLIVSRYLPIKSIDNWVSDPEGFIEQEDDNFIHEFESDRESSISYLAYSILEELLARFPVICAKQIKKYIENLTTGKLQSYDISIQDAIYNAISMMAKIYSLNLKSELPNLKPETFLTFLEEQITSTQIPMHSYILQRRYIILITKWIELIQEENILKYLANITKIMTNTDQLVLKFHACLAMKLILDFPSGKSSDQSETNTTLRDIKKLINYEELLTSSAKVIIHVFTCFNSAKVVWTMMNLLTLLIEKCQYRCNANIIQILELASLSTLFSFKHGLVQEALIEMCKALVMSFPSSMPILRLSIHLIDIRLIVIIYLML